MAKEAHEKRKKKEKAAGKLKLKISTNHILNLSKLNLICTKEIYDLAGTTGLPLI